jgi:hypothetical protein
MDTPGNHVKPVSHPVLTMRGQLAIPRLPSYGFGDLNGDGRRDLVVVRPSGQVTARISGLGRGAVKLPADVTLRLQGIAPLTGTGRDQVLIASTAAGAGTGYRLLDAVSVVLRVVGHRLVVVRSAHQKPWRLDFGAGRGDHFGGIRCRQDSIVQISVLLRGAGYATVTTTIFRLTGDQAERVSRTVRSRPTSCHTALGLSATHCPRLDNRGWAR